MNETFQLKALQSEDFLKRGVLLSASLSTWPQARRQQHCPKWSLCTTVVLAGRQGAMPASSLQLAPQIAAPHALLHPCRSAQLAPAGFPSRDGGQLGLQHSLDPYLARLGEQRGTAHPAEWGEGYSWVHLSKLSFYEMSI